MKAEFSAAVEKARDPVERVAVRGIQAQLLGPLMLRLRLIDGRLDVRRHADRGHFRGRHQKRLQGPGSRLRGVLALLHVAVEIARRIGQLGETEIGLDGRGEQVHPIVDRLTDRVRLKVRLVGGPGGVIELVVAALGRVLAEREQVDVQRIARLDEHFDAPGIACGRSFTSGMICCGRRTRHIAARVGRPIGREHVRRERVHHRPADPAAAVVVRAHRAHRPVVAGGVVDHEVGAAVGAPRHRCAKGSHPWSP